MNNREALYRAAISCRHEITHDQIILYVDGTKEGNALSQLADRLDQASQAQQPTVTDEMIVAAEAVEDLYRRGTPDTWKKVFLAMWREMHSVQSQQTESKPDYMPIHRDEWNKNVSIMWQCVRKHDCSIPDYELDLMRHILLTAVPPMLDKNSKQES